MARASLSHFVGLHGQLLAPFGGEPVELGAPVVFRCAFLSRNPPALDEPVQRRIERPLLHLQHVLGVALDGFGDGVAVAPARHQRAQDQQVQRALQ